MFSIISHDLRSPITTLQSLLFMFKSEEEFDEKTLKQYIGRLHENVEGVSGLLNNLLQWSRLQVKGGVHIAPQEVDLLPYFEETQRLLVEAALKKNITLEMEVAENLPKLKVDPGVLQFLLRNLLGNTYKFSLMDGVVRIRAELYEKTFIRISIIDHGIGISEERQSALFHDIVKSSPGTKSEQGTGLGLLLCREFIETSGGQIGVESTEGQGSTFWFTLPLS